MKSVYLLVLSSLILFCSTAPDFERDNIVDPNANIPNAIFINPINNSERSKVTENYFTIKLNSAFNIASYEVILRSDKDGIFYKFSTTNSDTLITTKTTLSSGVHIISLLIDDIVSDKILLNVNLANPVKIYEVELTSDGYKINWSEYDDPESDFRAYNIFMESNNGSTLLKQITEKGDTTFTHFDYPIEKSFSYYIELESSSNTKPSKSSKFEIKPLLFKGRLFLSQLNNELTLTEINFNSEFVNLTMLDLRTFDTKSTAINREYRSAFIVDKKEVGEIFFVSEKNILHQYILNDLESFRTFQMNVKPGYTDNGVNDILYSPSNKTYFVNFGHHTYSFDDNFKFINPLKEKPDQSVDKLQGVNSNNNILFGSSGISPRTMKAFQIDKMGRINSSYVKKGEIRFPASIPFTAISEKHNLLFVSNHGYIYKADTSLDFIGFLPKTNGYKTDYKIKPDNQDTLYMSTSNGYLYKYDIPTESLTFEKISEYPIKTMHLYKNDIYVILENNGLFKFVYKKF